MGNYLREMCDEDIRDALMNLETILPKMMKRIIQLERDVDRLKDNVHELGEGRGYTK